MLDGDYGVDDWFRNGYIDMCLSAVLSVKKKKINTCSIFVTCVHTTEILSPTDHKRKWKLTI